MKQVIVFFLMVFFIGLLACSNADNGGGKAPLNPNGDSELALLMREMEADAKRMKLQVKNGELPEVLKKFAEIHTAEPTEEGKTDGAEYQVYAQSYLQTIQAMQNADEETAPKLFNNIVESCMNCHQAMCPGPMVRIEKLYLPKETVNN